MPSLAKLGLWLLAARLAAATYTLPQRPDPMATAAVDLGEREIDSVVGTYITENKYKSLFCDVGRTPVAVDGYVLCSLPDVDPPGATTAVTACSDSYALYGTSSSYECEYPTTCGSMRVLLHTRATSTVTWIACGSALPATLYRNPPPTTVPPSSEPSTTTQLTSTSSIIAPPPPPSPPESKAWIAGAVIGGVVGLALIGFLVWWIMRRRRQKKQSQQPQQSQQSQQPQQPQQPMTPVTQVTEYAKGGSPPATSQWSSPVSTYGAPTYVAPEQQYQSQFPPPAPTSPSQMSQYTHLAQSSRDMHGGSPPPGPYPVQQTQWPAASPVHEMATRNYDGPVELGGNVAVPGSPPAER